MVTCKRTSGYSFFSFFDGEILFLAEREERVERGVLLRDGVGNLFSFCCDVGGEFM